MNRRRAGLRILVLSLVFSLIAVIPQGVLAQTKKGIELYNSWQFREAEKIFREALKADPSDVQANYYLGLSLLEQDKDNESLGILLKIKSSQDKADQKTRPRIPSEYQVQMALARARLHLNLYDEAWKNLESARLEDGKASDVYVYRGAYYLGQEKHEEALKELEKAISLDAQNPYAFYYQGIAYFHSGQPEKAVNALKNFLKLAPNAPEAGNANIIIKQLC
jgi:cytochrome c-type biogenesis protein CcmH/NrfG